MDLKELYDLIESFCKETHGSTDYHKETVFVKGRGSHEYAPFKFLSKKLESLKHADQLINIGFVFEAHDLTPFEDFEVYFEKQFSRKLPRSQARELNYILMPDNKSIFDSVETIDKQYKVLQNAHIILNGKNLPVQLGEWYAKCIFGLRQIKSTSQRGFDFYLGKDSIEIKVEWSDTPSPKGVKIKKSLIDLSKYTVIIYLAKNFRIREVCFLDSEFIGRKFYDKGHTVFLKDQDISAYFFSKGTHNIDKVVNSTSLLKFATSNLAMNMAEKFS